MCECRQKGTRSSGHSLRAILGFGGISVAWARPACPRFACFGLLLDTSNACLAQQCVNAAKRGQARLATRLGRFLGLGGFRLLGPDQHVPVRLASVCYWVFRTAFGGATCECRRTGTRSSGHSLRVIVGFGKILVARARPACPRLACLACVDLFLWLVLLFLLIVSADPAVGGVLALAT